MASKQSAKEIAQFAFDHMLHIEEVWVDEANQKYYLSNMETKLEKKDRIHKKFTREDDWEVPNTADDKRISYVVRGIADDLKVTDEKDIPIVVEMAKEYFAKQREAAGEDDIINIATDYIKSKKAA